jgi:hypothetical protein
VFARIGEPENRFGRNRCKTGIGVEGGAAALRRCSYTGVVSAETTLQMLWEQRSGESRFDGSQPGMKDQKRVIVVNFRLL